MFIVKAVKADESYELFEALNVRVRESGINGCSAAGSPPFIAPDFDVCLDKNDEAPGKIISVGNGQDHFAHVYVMNEHGKTVDVISWVYDERIAPPIGRARRAA